MYASARFEIYNALAKAFAPRRHLSVSEWADLNVILSTKESPEPGPWRTHRNPLLKEIMDCFSTRSTVREVVAMLPIQIGKSMIGRTVLGYNMSERPGPFCYALPSEVAREKAVDQKINPLIENTPAIRGILKTENSRNSANRRYHKDFLGGMLTLEHAGSPGRLKSSSFRLIIVDELTDFALALTSGDDPVKMLQGRMSAFPSTGQILYIGTPGTEGLCRLTTMYEQSDQRRYQVPCPHCLTLQPLFWLNFQFDHNGKAWYVCEHCACVIEEINKTEMIRNGRWVANHPERTLRGYTANCLYYPIGLGPRWSSLAKMWHDAQGNTPALKTFVNDRLAEAFYDPALRAMKLHSLADRGEPYPLRVAPEKVKGITAGVDTQNDRLECQLTGWGDNMEGWALDYIVFDGDPADEAVWIKLADYLNTPVPRQDGLYLPISATAIDAGGHRTHAVYNFVRMRLITRPMAIFGSKMNRDPPLGKPKPQDVTWRGRTDKNGVFTRQVGTVYCKKWFLGQLATSAEQSPELRTFHFSEQFAHDYFKGLLSEIYNPKKDRYDKIKPGIRNEPLDITVYSYAAAHHEDLQWHKKGAERWPVPIGNEPAPKTTIFIPE